MEDYIKYKTQWIVTKYADQESYFRDDFFEKSVIDGNLMLNEGLQELLLLLTGGGGTAFNNANSFIGVGDSSVSEAATQTALQASTNKLYKAMASTYPQTSGQTITFRGVFGTSDANFAWNEFTICNNSNESTGKNLNRKVSSQGTKASGQTWTLDLSITFS